MRKRTTLDAEIEPIHWEELIRTMVDLIGVEAVEETLDYVIAQIKAEREKLKVFAIDRNVGH